jgi:hypothetical protein
MTDESEHRPGHEMEAHDDPRERRPGSAGGPEQVGILFGIASQQLAIGGDDVDRDDALGGPAPAALVPALAALEEEAADADRWAMSTVEEPAPRLEVRREGVASAGRRLRRRDPGLEIEGHLLELPEIDEQPALAHAPRRPGVSTRSHGDTPAPLASEQHPVDDILHRPGDEHRVRPPIGSSAVEDASDSGLLETGFAVQEEPHPRADPPPSTTRLTPVIHDASSEARNSAAFTTSSG